MGPMPSEIRSGANERTARDRFGLVGRVAAWFSLGIYLVGVVAMILLSPGILDDAEGLSFTVAFGVFPVVGLVILLKRPRNPLGWNFAFIGLIAGIGLFSWSYSEYSYFVADEPLPLAVLVAWAGSWTWYPLIASIVVLPLLLFPEGLLSRRWRPVLWTAIGTVVAVTLLTATPSTFVMGETAGGAAELRLENPFGLWESNGNVEDHPVLQGAWIVLLGLVGLGVLSLVLRFRRSRGRERLQMKWFMFAGALMLANLTVGSLIPSFDDSFVSGAMFVIAIAALPATCGIAIVRHQLYDIDVIINRTLVYGLLTAILIGAYLGIVFVLQQLLTGVTEDSDLAVAASTLAVAAMFTPLRSRIQAFIDRRFYRRKYNVQQTLQGFTTQVRDEVDIERLAGGLASVVQETMQPAHVSLWVRPAGS